MANLIQLRQDFEDALQNTSDVTTIEALRQSWLGKKGTLNDALKSLRDLPIEEKKTFGRDLNILKNDILEKILLKKQAFSDQALDQKLSKEKVDLSLPVRGSTAKGTIHPITQTIEELVHIFGQLGFEWAEGPTIETDFHNFSALNIPEEHPAREMQDTFYVDQPKNTERVEEGAESNEANTGALVLRTHTSPVQIRTMLSKKPPIRIIVPGRTYRSDYDLTHTPMFHQIEGLVIDKQSNMRDLLATLRYFVAAYFEKNDIPMRFRSSYFPFTEPSAEVDIACKHNKDKIEIGGGDSWLEILGCGMVHPQVLRNCGLDPDEYQGYAFGMGIERIAMLKHGIPDLRRFFESDLRWLRHYGFTHLQTASGLGGLGK
jgi:phenylalanyl-tRNA synthetase alpha chain